MFLIGRAVLTAAFAATLLRAPSLAQQAKPKPHIIVFVIDGLRPDQITTQKMPNLYRFEHEGTMYLHSHSTFPTVTRVNASTLSTGVYPDKHGILSNSLNLPSFSQKSLSTGEEENLLKLASLQHNRILAVDSLSEILTRGGLHFVAISSGSTGGATLLAPEARHGTATLINAGLGGGKQLAYPQSIDDTIRSRFGFTAAHEGLSSVEWTERVLREYVIPELHPDVVIDWITEPDTSQHKYGIGSPEALHALSVVDNNFGQFLKTLEDRHELASTDIIVTADHGFSSTGSPLSLSETLSSAKIDPAELAILNDGQTVSFYLRSTDSALKLDQLQRLTVSLQQQTNVDLLFTRSSTLPGTCVPGATKGFLAGTLALEKVHQCAATGPDLIITTSWDNDTNSFGDPGASTQASSPGATEHSAASHGGLSEWTVHTPLILHGPDFQQRRALDLPAANIDIPATVAYLFHVSLSQAQGRPLLEAFRNAKSSVKKPVARTFTATDHGVTRTLEVTTFQGEDYIDRSTRTP